MGSLITLIRHREELHLRAVVIPTWVYAILWRSSFVYTSALIRKSCNSNPCTINHTPHGPINSGRPPRRSIVALSLSANSYLLLLGVTIFILRLATIFALFFSIPTEFTTEPLFSRWQHSKKMLMKRDRRSFFFFRQRLFESLCAEVRR